MEASREVTPIKLYIILTAWLTLLSKISRYF